ncbi:MAG TPA: guanylate kinase [Edaphocola sp.]|nr:guanylate kinase [Edaphocola sp.]
MNKILIITAPSGSGKSTIIKRILEIFPQLKFSISACTRSQRATEVNGVDYYFISVDNFKRKIINNDFVEWEMVYEDKYYGTLKSELDRIWSENNIPLFDVDVKGALHVKRMYGNNTTAVFIKTPSEEVLKNRLIKRNTDTPQSIQERLEKAAYEATYASKFDYIVINDDLEVAVQEISTIIQNFLS